MPYEAGAGGGGGALPEKKTPISKKAGYRTRTTQPKAAPKPYSTKRKVRRKKRDTQTVTEGDNWFNLTEKVYGADATMEQMNRLMEANPEVRRLRPGQRIRVPGTVRAETVRGAAFPERRTQRAIRGGGGAATRVRPAIPEERFPVTPAQMRVGSPYEEWYQTETPLPVRESSVYNEAEKYLRNRLTQAAYGPERLATEGQLPAWLGWLEPYYQQFAKSQNAFERRWGRTLLSQMPGPPGEMTPTEARAAREEGRFPYAGPLTAKTAEDGAALTTDAVTAPQQITSMRIPVLEKLIEGGQPPMYLKPWEAEALGLTDADLLAAGYTWDEATGRWVRSQYNPPYPPSSYNYNDRGYYGGYGGYGYGGGGGGGSAEEPEPIYGKFVRRTPGGYPPELGIFGVINWKI